MEEPWVTPEWYASEWKGEPIADADFPRLEARAEDVVDVYTAYAVRRGGLASLGELERTLVKKAVCAQMEYFASHGFEAGFAADGGGFTVGKVSVQNPGAEVSGRLAAYASPMAMAFLERAGLLGRRVCWC